MRTLLIIVLILFSSSLQADSIRFIIVESNQTSDKQVILNRFPNHNLFPSKKECESALVSTALSKNSFRTAINRNGEIFVVEYWGQGGIHTSLKCAAVDYFQ